VRIIISGYGKMGKEIEKTALERNHSIAAIIDNNTDWEKLSPDPPVADVIIDFSMPDYVTGNIKKAFSLNIPIVSGTTGWFQQLPEIIELCREKNQTLFYASNFSIGVNVFFELNKRLAILMCPHKEYDVRIEETHHLQKLDAPSGTAISLADDILNLIGRKQQWLNNQKTDKNSNILHIKSNRIEDVTGIHSVFFESDIDVIEIKHTAKNRKGFALGAVMAAEWVLNKKGVFQMKDMLNF